MTPLMVVCAVAGGLGVAALLLGAIAFARAGKLFRLAQQQSAAGQADCQSTVETLTETIGKVTKAQHELERQLVASATGGPPKPALNLTKRSQALRMHRHGDPPEQIASMLEVPRQEVDLLIKVHQIVMNNI